MLARFLSTWFSEHTSHWWGLLQWGPSPPPLPGETQRVLLPLLEGNTDRVGELLPRRKAAPELSSRGVGLFCVSWNKWLRR